MRFICLYIFAASILINCGCHSNATIADSAPDFTLSTLDNEQVTLSKINQKATLICFWAVGCPGCRMEVPHLVELHEKYAPKGLKILAVNSWDEPPELISGFVKSKNLPYTILTGGGQVAAQYKVQSIPRNFLIDAHHNIAYAQVGDGFIQRKHMITKIEELLK